MKKLSDDEICKVVDVLIGEVDATGEANTDRRRLSNLESLIQLTDACLDKIYNASCTSNSSEYSMMKIGKTALKYLGELAEWFERQKERLDNEEFGRLNKNI